jgi:lysophospholipase L1-like esterase
MELTRKVARETGVVLVDHFARWDAAQAGGTVLQTWTTDGCHPNVTGHTEMARDIAVTLLPLARAVAP